MFISPEGEFFICEKVGYSFPIGDIISGLDVDKIYSVIDDYIKVSIPTCLDCWALRFCKSCFVKAQKGNSFNTQRKRDNCTLIKWSIDNALKLFSEIMEKNPKCLKTLDEKETYKGLDVAFKFIEDYRNGSHNEKEL